MFPAAAVVGVGAVAGASLRTRTLTGEFLTLPLPVAQTNKASFFLRKKEPTILGGAPDASE